MTMTAIAKGFIRIMKLLSEYGSRQEDNNLDKWTNKYKTTITIDQQQHDEHPSINLICAYYTLLCGFQL